MNSEKEKPLIDDALAGYSIKGSDSSENLPSRISRYGKAKARSLENCNFLDRYSKSLVGSIPVKGLNGDYFEDSAEYSKVNKLRSTLSDCSNWMVFHHYYTVDKVRLARGSFCKKHLMCPLCAIRRGAKSLKAYLDRYEVIRSENPNLRPYFLTLTVSNGHDLSERMAHLNNSFKKYMKRKRTAESLGRGYCELNKIEGGVFTYEFTYSDEKGWHPHLHMVALCDPNNLPNFPIGSKSGQAKRNSLLSQEWLDVTGDSYIVDFRPIENDPVEGFIEVFKYALKFSDLTPEKNYEAFKLLSGKRLQGSFGAFWGVKVPETMTDDLLDELPYIELIYRYTRSGYSLDEYKKVDV